ncbi:MAG: PQQ-like beta-propeller repeat protein [Deltaproteobacteria bacterium]|nr:PQQ-like beta-propeller repeat protein [Deltaproteobacteria bacterium]
MSPLATRLLGFAVSCLVAPALGLLVAACGGDDAAPTDVVDTLTGDDDVVNDVADTTGGDHAVPLDPASPWPKFRRDARQTGRSPVTPTYDGSTPWTFATGKGVFSTPVVDGDGGAYVGSADRTFYALAADGSERWRFATGEIIDSSALLDDAGAVIFGSGDGHVYALDRATGEPRWTFAADAPADTGAFINWFEGNVALTADGTLLVEDRSRGVRLRHARRRREPGAER